jgi:predicted dehydrogenase
MEKILVVGCGSIGRRHAANFRAAGVKYIAGANRRAERLEQMQAQVGLEAGYADFREALAKDRFDAVLVCVPPHLHTEVCLAAAEAGAHLFIEKPLALTTDGLDELGAICRAKRLTAFVAYGYRFIPSVEKVRALVSAGRIGRILSVRLEMSMYLPDWHPWEDYRATYMAKKEQGGGALYDESHAIDLMRWLVGEIETVHAFVGKMGDLDITGDDLVSLIVRFAGGAVGHLHMDVLGRTPRIGFELIGSEGTILWDRIDHGVRLFDAKEKRWEVYPFTAGDVLSMYPREVEHFIHCVRTGAEPLVSLADGRRTLDVILAALEASASECVVRIKKGR